MRGADFGLGAFVQLLIALAVGGAVAVVLLVVVAACWLFGVEPAPWMGWPAGGWLLGVVCGLMLHGVLSPD